jgi:hypothetical protein
VEAAFKTICRDYWSQFGADSLKEIPPAVARFFITDFSFSVGLVISKITVWLVTS